MKFRNYLTETGGDAIWTVVLITNPVGRKALLGAMKALKWEKDKLKYYSKAQQQRDGVESHFGLAGKYAGHLTQQEIDDLRYVVEYIAKEWKYENMLQMGVEIY